MKKVRIPRLSWCYVPHRMKATAQDLAAKVLAEKTGGLRDLDPRPLTSLYYWEGKLEQEYEVQMILKNYRISPAGTAGMT